MIYAHPTTGNASEDAQAPEGYTLTFATPAEYHAWQAANFPPPAEVPVAPQVPAEVTNAQLRLALVDFGIMPSSISAYIDAMPEGADKERAYTAWWQTNHMRRDHPMIEQFRVMLGLTAEQVDQLFILAATLG